MKLIDPLKITGDFPIIVLSSHNNAFISWAIRWFTKGSYNHAMFLISYRTLASQAMFYTEKDIKKYMRKGFKLKFYGLKIALEEREIVLNRITARLRKPKWKNFYDFLGIFGQFFRIRKLNNPYRNYCSESVEEDLKGIIKLPYKPSPADINEFAKANPEKFEYLGHFIFD